MNPPGRDAEETARILFLRKHTISSLLMQWKRQAVKYRLAALVFSLITILLLLFRNGRVSSNLKEYIPSIEHAAAHLVSGNTLLNQINNATLGFEKIFVVSLPERTDHRDRLLLASKVSGINLEFVDGVRGDAIPAKVLPANFNQNLGPNDIGAWRAHINAITEIVSRNLSSALIIEDDVDWDVRLKPSLRNFALCANALQNTHVQNLNFKDISSIAPPHYSPYGDKWDLLWLGHCGMHLPTKGGIVIQEDDSTVPEHRYLRSFVEDEATPLLRYPEHTRAVFQDVVEGTCSLAYAVTQDAARNILYDLGIDRLAESFDLSIRGWCEGSESHLAGVCFSVLPQLFDHYRRAGPADVDSDIAAPHATPRTQAYTNNIRWSVSMNLKKLLSGNMNYDDQYPDS